MKLAAISTLLFTSSQAFAHTSLAPHTHESNQTNWLPSIATAAVLSVIIFTLTRRLKVAKPQRVVQTRDR